MSSAKRCTSERHSASGPAVGPRQDGPARREVAHLALERHLAAVHLPAPAGDRLDVERRLRRPTPGRSGTRADCSRSVASTSSAWRAAGAPAGQPAGASASQWICMRRPPPGDVDAHLARLRARAERRQREPAARTSEQAPHGRAYSKPKWMPRSEPGKPSGSGGSGSLSVTARSEARSKNSTPLAVSSRTARHVAVAPDPEVDHRAHLPAGLEAGRRRPVLRDLVADQHEVVGELEVPRVHARPRRSGPRCRRARRAAPAPVEGGAASSRAGSRRPRRLLRRHELHALRLLGLDVRHLLAAVAARRRRRHGPRQRPGLEQRDLHHVGPRHDERLALAHGEDARPAGPRAPGPSRRGRRASPAALRRRRLGHEAERGHAGAPHARDQLARWCRRARPGPP